MACDFLTVDMVWLRRFCVAFFIELGSRGFIWPGVTAVVSAFGKPPRFEESPTQLVGGQRPGCVGVRRRRNVA